MDQLDTLLGELERTRDHGSNAESMRMMMRAGREISYWREAYERVVPEDQWMGSFRESSYYARSAARPWSESPDIASRPPRPRSSRQPGT